jgi:hypothetical protein
MRSVALLVCLTLTAFAIAVPTAHAYIGAPVDHGPDGSAVDLGTEAPGPDGGPSGKPLPRRDAYSPKARMQLGGAQAHDRLPAAWCGTETGSDDSVNEMGNGTYKYHAIYAIPSDAPDRFNLYSTSMQSDAFQASSLLESTYGRAIRFDLGTNCGQQYLDISVVRLPQTTAQMQQLAPSATGTLDAVSNAIDAAGFHTIRPNDTVETASTRSKNYVVWLDAPYPPGSCGQATSFDDQTRDQSNLNNLAGKVAVVFLNGQGGFCSSNTVRHEIGHNLGALQPTAPHAFDGAHCNDAYEDTMCYTNSPKVTVSGIRGQFFDYKNDDYWDPPNGTPLPWWTANLNRFLCPDAYCNVAPGTTDITGPTTPIIPPDTSSGNSDNGTVFGTNGVKAAKPTIKAKAKKGKPKKGRRTWTISMRARGKGNAVVTLRCRPRLHDSIRTVYRKRTKLPKSLRAKVTCVTTPRATILADG